MKAIQDYFNNLGRGQFDDVVRYRERSQPTSMISLHIHRIDYITKVLIPFFDNLTWHSKKAKDYQDWKAILDLRKLGLHHTEQGLKVINLIINQMNSDRLSSKSKSSSVLVDRALLDIKIGKLLKGSSNYEERENGRIFIKSLNIYLSSNAKTRIELQDDGGNVIKIFDSMSDCAKYLGVARMTVTNKLRTGKAVLFNNTLVYVKKESER